MSDDDPTGFRATILSLFAGGVPAIAVELWLYFRPNPVRGMQRELVSVPIFVVLTVLSRLVARPWLRRRWVSTVRGYSFEQAETELFPHLAEAVERSELRERADQARVFRERLDWKRDASSSA